MPFAVLEFVGSSCKKLKTEIIPNHPKSICYFLIEIFLRPGQRLLKPGGRIIPAGGCQYVTLVQLADPTPWFANDWRGFKLSGLRSLQDTIYWKAKETQR
jgi:hypothetical protein